MINQIDNAYSEVLLFCREKKFDRARAVCDRLEVALPGDVKRIGHLRAIVERRAGNLAGAKSILENALDGTLEGIANRHALLRILVRERNWSEALSHAEEVIDASDRIDNEAFVNSSCTLAAYCLLELRRNDEGIEYLKRCSAASDDERLPVEPALTIGELRRRLAGR